MNPCTSLRQPELEGAGADGSRMSCSLMFYDVYLMEVVAHASEMSKPPLSEAEVN